MGPSLLNHIAVPLCWQCFVRNSLARPGARLSLPAKVRVENPNAHPSPALPLLHWAVFCLLSLCLSTARAALEALRPLKPQGPKKQGPGSPQTRKLVAFSDCTGPRVEICWSYCTPVPLLPFPGGPFLPTIAIQLLSVSTPPIHFLQ